MTVTHRELRASREEMQNLIQDIKTSQEDFQRAATRIETLEFEWTVWHTEDGQAPPARDPPPELLGSSGAGLITQQLEDLLGFDHTNQGQSPTDGPTEFQLTPNYTPRSGDGQEPDRHDSLMEWWRNPSPQGRPQAFGPARGQVPEGNLPQLTTGDRATVTMGHDAPPGFGLTMDPTIGNLSRRRPEIFIPVTRRAAGETGPGGVVRPQATLSADDSDVFSFFAGMRPRNHLEEIPGGPQGGVRVWRVLPCSTPPRHRVAGYLRSRQDHRLSHGRPNYPIRREGVDRRRSRPCRRCHQHRWPHPAWGSST